MLVGLAAPFVGLRIAARRRTKAFDRQLPDVLATIASTLRAGHGLRTALRRDRRRRRPPSSEEFGQRPRARSASAGRSTRRSPRCASGSARPTSSTSRPRSTCSPRPAARSRPLRHPLGDRSRAAAARPQGQRADLHGPDVGDRARRRCRSGSAALMTVISPSYMAPLYTTSSGHMLIVVCSARWRSGPAPQANRLGEV